MAGNKFTWGKDDVTATLSQCAYCKHNESITGCSKFGKKPDEYALNERECPEREAE